MSNPKFQPGNEYKVTLKILSANCLGWIAVDGSTFIEVTGNE